MTTENNEQVVDNELVITSLDEGWSDYVMTHFFDKELDNGKPRVAGLRRVCEKLIGKIHSFVVKTINVPNRDNQYTATVECSICLLGKDGHAYTFSEVGDANHRNTDGVYSRFLPQIASVRARARALRLALSLDIVSADEVSEIAELEMEEPLSDDKISETQITAISNICKRLNINVKAFTNIGKSKYNNIKDVPYDLAIKMTQQLSKYQQDISIIPDTIKTFDDDWRSSYYEG